MGSMLVVSHTTISGQPIARVDAVDMIRGIARDLPADAVWAFHGVASNDRYTTRVEKPKLIRKQAPIGRPEATCSALILLRKRAQWWTLTQDDRRRILEEGGNQGMVLYGSRSRHSLSQGRSMSKGAVPSVSIRPSGKVRSHII